MHWIPLIISFFLVVTKQLVQAAPKKPQKKIKKIKRKLKETRVYAAVVVILSQTGWYKNKKLHCRLFPVDNTDNILHLNPQIVAAWLN